MTLEKHFMIITDYVTRSRGLYNDLLKREAVSGYPQMTEF